MTTQMLEAYTATLTTMKEKTMAKMHDHMHAFAGEHALPPDEVDRASMESDRNFALLMRERDRKALAGIREALARIEAGEYGICEECEEEIAVARLQAQPMATLCVLCKSRREDEERMKNCSAAGFFQG